MIELKPCPFCGGEPEVEQQGSNRQSHIIACTDCGCRLESNEVWNAGSQWNRRMEAEQKALKLLEDERGSSFHERHTKAREYKYSDGIFIHTCSFCKGVDALLTTPKEID